jgi:hypothetical protein
MVEAGEGGSRQHRRSGRALGLADDGQDTLQCDVATTDDEIVRQAQYPIAALAELGIATSIVLPLRGIVMRRTVELNHRLLLDAEEIGYVFSYRYLAPEFQVGQPRATQRAPQYGFGVRHLAPQPPGEAQLLVDMSAHGG